MFDTSLFFLDSIPPSIFELQKGGECHRSPINAGYLALDKFYIDDGLAIIAYAVAPVYTNTTNPHHHLTKSGPEVPMLITCRS